MAKTTYISQINGKMIFAERAQYTYNGTNIDSKFSEIDQKITAVGAFEVVPLTTPVDPKDAVPDVSNPSTKVIYLTKESGSSKTDPYTEWIWIPASTSPSVEAHWEIIGETSLDLSGYKTKQSVASVTGGTLKGVASMSQNENGEVTLTLNDIQDGTTSQKGVVQLEDSHTSTSTTTAATPKNVKEAYDLANGKYSKPAEGIPSTDMTSAVQTSLGAADTAVQSVKISGVETELKSGTNVVIPTATTSASGTVQLAGSIGETVASENNKAASEKAVRDAIDGLNVGNKADKVTGATSGNFAALDVNGNLVDSNHTHSDYKTVQSAVADPSADGTGLTFIATASQNANGEIAVTKKTVQSASTSQSGIVQLQDSIGATETTDDKAATPKSVRDAINALDVSNITENLARSKTITGLSETDGKISATAEDIQIAETQVTNLTTDLAAKAAKLTTGFTADNFASIGSDGAYKDSGKKAADFATATHVHGNITNEGKIGSTADLAVVTTTDGVVNAVTLATASPSTDASATSIAFIDTVSQDSKGKISATKKTVANAVASVSNVGGSAGLMSASDKEKLNGIDSGAQVNVIETVKSNGTALTPDENKAVDIPAASTSAYGVVTFAVIELDEISTNTPAEQPEGD